MALLQAVHGHYRSHPSPTLEKVRGASRCSTLPVEQWDLAPNRIHLIGIRHRRQAEPGARQVLDDVFVLLVRGVAFKFYGSTEPGATKPKNEPNYQYPFLVQGQHLYRFGWHKLSGTDWKEKVFHALKPVDPGVWVLRSTNVIPEDADLQGNLDGPNTTINVHWSGGVTQNATWSAGCQVITGQSYINHRNEPVNCSRFAANATMSEEAYDRLGRHIDGAYRTKGAYSVLEDLVVALSGAGQEDRVVRYMLLLEEDLTLLPEIGESAAGTILAQLKSSAPS